MNRREFLVSAAVMAAMPKSTIEALAKGDTSKLEKLAVKTETKAKTFVESASWSKEDVEAFAFQLSVTATPIKKGQRVALKTAWFADDENAAKLRKLGVRVKKQQDGFWKIMIGK